MTPRMWLAAVVAVFLPVGAVALADATNANGAATLLAIIVSVTIGGLLFVRSFELR